MSQLLLEKNRPLGQSEDGDEVRVIAQARTLTVLSILDNGRRKRSVLQFLYESGLISKDSPVINLAGANLRHADLGALNLYKASLYKADLRWSILEFTNLREADLRKVHLLEANWLTADLSEADLSGAYLWDVKGITNEELDRQATDLCSNT